VRIVRNVPWWGLVSSAAAPVLLVGGWSGAARLQPRPVDPVADTVSAGETGQVPPSARAARDPGPGRAGSSALARGTRGQRQ